MIVYNKTLNMTVAEKVEKAEDSRSRSVGLLSRGNLAPEEGLWIVPCPMIHTFFMKFPIDAVFLDKDMVVVKILAGMRPWRLSPWVFSARSVLELPAGRCEGRIKRGDVLEIM